MEFYKVVSNINFDLEEILSSIKYGEIKYYNGYESKTYKIKDFIQILNSSIIKIANVHTKKFEQLNQNIEKLFNDARDRILNSDYSFAHEYNKIWNKIDTDDGGIFSNFILFISAIEDRIILDRLTKEGFLKEKTSKILKMLFLGSVSKTKSDYGKDVKTYIEFTDLQKSESNKIFESEFNNPEFIPVFKATQPNEKNFRCFKKLKLEGKDVSNWTNWIKIYLLNYIVNFYKSDEIYIDYASEKLKEKYSLDEVLNQFINLNLNVFSKKFLESEEIQILNQDEIIKNILNSFVGLKKDNQNIINKHFQYLEKIKDKIEKEIYYCYIFSLINVLEDGENFDKLISLVDKQSVEFFNALNKYKEYSHSMHRDNLLKILLQKNIINISDCIKNILNLDNSIIEQFANYKLRKIIEENNLEKIKSFLDFLKQNKISLYLNNSNGWGYEQPFPFEKIDIKLLPIEVIEKMIENEQIEFYKLSNAIGKNDELVRKLLKFVNKDKFNSLLDSVEDPKLKEEIMIKRLETSNDFSINFETFKELGPKKVNLEKLIKDLNGTPEKKEDYFLEILFITLATDKKDEILNNIDKNIFKNLFTSVGPKTESEWQESKKECGNGKIIELLIKDCPKLVEFLNQKNLNNSLNIIKKYLPEDRKDILQKWIDSVSYTSERKILRFNSFIVG